MTTVTRIPGFRSNRKMQVAAYIRVSTTMGKQEESFENQKTYYEQKIKDNPEWELAGIYGDEMSGTHSKNREEFQKLISDAMEGKIDLILCKSVSRWARNMRISENMKWTYRQKKTQGKFYGRKGMYYGYDTKDDEFKANADAENVRYIFESYANGLGMKEIADELNTRGIKNKKEREWTRGTVKYILKNEVYVGDVIFNKTPSRNVISGEIDKDWEARYVKDHHAGIISRELWDAVQKRMAERRKRNTKGIALFSPSSEGR